MHKVKPYLARVRFRDHPQIATYKAAFQARGEQINGGLQLQHFSSFLLWFLHIRYCSLPYWLHPHLPRACIFLMRKPGEETIIGDSFAGAGTMPRLRHETGRADMQ